MLGRHAWEKHLEDIYFQFVLFQPFLSLDLGLGLRLGLRSKIFLFGFRLWGLLGFRVCYSLIRGGGG